MKRKKESELLLTSDRATVMHWPLQKWSHEQSVFSYECLRSRCLWEDEKISEEFYFPFKKGVGENYLKFLYPQIFYFILLKIFCGSFFSQHRNNYLSAEEVFSPWQPEQSILNQQCLLTSGAGFGTCCCMNCERVFEQCVSGKPSSDWQGMSEP